MAEGKKPRVVPIRWTVSRMRRLMREWHLLRQVDKNYILRRIRDEEPHAFFVIANEVTR